MELPDAGQILQLVWTHIHVTQDQLRTWSQATQCRKELFFPRLFASRPRNHVKRRNVKSATFTHTNPGEHSWTLTDHWQQLCLQSTPDIQVHISAMLRWCRTHELITLQQHLQWLCSTTLLQGDQVRFPTPANLLLDSSHLVSHTERLRSTIGLARAIDVPRHDFEWLKSRDLHDPQK